MTAPEPAPIRSEYATDPDMAGLVELFVGELNERTETIRGALRERDWETLWRAAHQLRGASGGYGFPAIGAKAADLEDALRGGAAEDLDVLKRRVDELVSYCDRAAA